MRVVTLKPSIWRTGAALLLMVGGCMVASGFTATAGQFWSHTRQLVGVVMLAFGIVWILFVPVRLEFDRVELTIRYLLGRACTIPWYELEYYGPANNVFVLQFESRSFQLFPAAFGPQDWHQLLSFLCTRFPECKADGYVGWTLFRWRKK